MSLLGFPDLTTPSPWFLWQQLAPRLALTAPVTPLTSGDTSTLQLPGPGAQRGPEPRQHSVLLPPPSGRAGHWQRDLKRSQGEEAPSATPRLAKQINK